MSHGQARGGVEHHDLQPRVTLYTRLPHSLDSL